MSDDTKPDLLVPDRRLAVPDSRIVSIDEVREEKREREKPRTAKGAGADFVTREEIVRIVAKINEGISTAALAVGQKVYDQVVDETQAHLEKMHFQIRQDILAEIEARTLRARLRKRWLALKDRVTPWLMEVGLVSPIVEKPALRIVDPVEALDPNAVAAMNEMYEREMAEAGENPNTETVQ